MFLQSSKQLETAIHDTLKKAMDTPCFYKIRYIFTQTESEWLYEPEKITGLTIMKQYVGTYFDDIQIGFKAHPTIILEMLQKAQDLFCTIIATPHSWRTFLPFEEEQFVEKYRVIIENPGDMAKRLNLDLYEPVRSNTKEPHQRDIELDITFQLLDEFTYETRHRKMKAIFGANTTVEKAMQYVINGFQIDKAEVAVSPNKLPFNNMEIPDDADLSSVFAYIQQAHGVYPKGLGSYCANKTLHIWPPFETHPDTPHTIHILAATKNSYEAQDCYHYVNEDEDIYIVSTTGVETKNEAELGAENVGTDVMVTNADKLLDHGGKVSGSGEYKIADDRMSSAAFQKDNIKITNAQNVGSGGVTSNVYVAASQLASTNGVYFSCGWTTSTLVETQPGQKVVVHYDDDKGRYTTQTGSLSSITFKMTRTQIRAHSSYFWVFQSSILAFLEPEKEEEA